jgi:hypothetical protein
VKFNTIDQSNCENLVRALKKGKFELEGLEIIAMADVFKWVTRLHATIQSEIAADAAASTALAKAENPITHEFITHEESSEIPS